MAASVSGAETGVETAWRQVMATGVEKQPDTVCHTYAAGRRSGSVCILSHLSQAAISRDSAFSRPIS